VEALAGPDLQAALGRLAGAVVLEARAGLDRLEGTDQARVGGVLSEQAPRELLLAGPTGREVTDRSIVLDGLVQGRGLDPLNGRVDVALEVQQPHPRPAEQGVHGQGAVQGDQLAPEHEPVKTGQNGADGRGVSG
jgi:hypothetical protein